MFVQVNFISSLQDILDNLLKEERKSKIKDNKENLKKLTKSLIVDEPEDVAPIQFAPSSLKKSSKLEQEEKELLEVSLMADDEEDAERVLETASLAEVKPSPAPKEISAKPINVESTIFNELKGIDFETEIREEDEGKIDWNTVSSSTIIWANFFSKSFLPSL